jgi:eukaryotic-like serine/threonine-protein kinase
MSLMLGKSAARRTVGSYELLEVIGEGGMADVYLGIKKSISNIRNFYAVKVVKPAHVRDERFSRMFLDEARVMASIRHPNLVTLHDMLVHDGQYLIVMEYLKGLDGRRLLGRSGNARQPVPVEVALNIVYQACIGLHYAHEAKSIEGDPLQLVHRDISPHNLFITFDGYVKVLDFGIAKSEIQEEETRSGFLKGKIPYLSPEQCTSDAPIDRRTDVYALGVVLYELLTGRRPFEGRNEIQVIQAIIGNDAASPAYHAPGLSADVCEVVLKALAKRPADRYADCDALRDALSRVAVKHQWMLSERTLASYLEQSHGDYKAALEARLVGLLSSTGDNPESLLEVPYEDRSVQRMTLGPDCLGAMSQSGEFIGYKLSGQLRESFDFGPLVDRHNSTVILDLAGITRLTSFGIRQWLMLLPKLRESNKRVLLNRLSVAMANQMVTIPAMTEGTQILSMMVPFHCSSCAHQFDAVVRAGEFIPMVIKCVRCESDAANFDEDDSYLSPLRHGKVADEMLKSFVEELERVDEMASRGAVEKHITAERTEINLQGDVPSSTRWDRLIAGVEGELRVEFLPGTFIDEGTWKRFEGALGQIDEDVKLSIWGFPCDGPQGLERLPVSKNLIKSVIFASSCAKCGRVEHREWKLGSGEASTLCRQCSELLKIVYDASMSPAGVEDKNETSRTNARTQTMTAVTAVTPATKPTHNARAGWIFPLIVAVLIGAIIAAVML